MLLFKQKTAYEIPKRDWSSDVCSSDLRERDGTRTRGQSETAESAGSRGRLGSVELGAGASVRRHRGTDLQSVGQREAISGADPERNRGCDIIRAHAESRTSIVFRREPSRVGGDE